MNPKTVLGQSIAAGLLLLALAAFGRPTLVIVLAGVGLTWAIALNLLYAAKLGTRGRTERRMTGDRAIARQLLVSYVTPIAASIGLLLAAWELELDLDPFTTSEVQGLLGVAAATLVLWLASSHVDWYYIRPRVDGVLSDPPCRTSRDTMWKGVTRNWYIHRAVASAATMFAVVAVAGIVTVLLNREWPSGLAAVGGFAAIISVGFWLMSDEIASAKPTSRSIRSPRYWLGDDLTYETDKWRRRGYVLHISIPQTKLVRLDPDTGERVPHVDYLEESTSELAEVHCQPAAFAGCTSNEQCGRMNRECLVGAPRVEVGRRHFFVM
jgi:hypothetical protein